MKIKLLITSLAVIAACIQCKAVKPSSAIGADNATMVIGTYTDTGSCGLYSYRFNQTTGATIVLDSCKIDNPSYFTFNSSGDILYAVSENNVDNSVVSAIGFDKDSGRFKTLNSVDANGSPCYISTNGKIVVTANYGGGTLSVFPIDKKGMLKPMSQQFEGSIGGPDSLRQNLPHVHCVEFSPDGKYLYATDFSSDRILIFKVTSNRKEIEPVIDAEGKQACVPVAPDSGPRHLIFDATGQHAYLIGELSGAVTVFDVDGYNLIPIESVVADTSHGRASADIHLSPNGKFLFVSTRKTNETIRIFNVDEATGKISFGGILRAVGHPRNFAFSPNGKFILIAYRDGNNIRIYTCNTDTGALRRLDNTIELSKPVCIKFAP